MDNFLIYLDFHLLLVLLRWVDCLIWVFTLGDNVSHHTGELLGCSWVFRKSTYRETALVVEPVLMRVIVVIAVPNNWHQKFEVLVQYRLATPQLLSQLQVLKFVCQHLIQDSERIALFIALDGFIVIDFMI